MGDYVGSTMQNAHLLAVPSLPRIALIGWIRPMTSTISGDAVHTILTVVAHFSFTLCVFHIFHLFRSLTFGSSVV